MTDTPPDKMAPPEATTLPTLPDDGPVVDQRPAVPDVPVVSPLAAPARPTQDGIIDPIWGQWVHDRQLGADLQLLARLSAAQVLGADNQFIVVRFDSVPVDVSGKWNASTWQWQAPRAGTLEVVASIPTTAAAPAGGAIVGHIGSVFVAGAEYRIGQIIAIQVSAWTASGSVLVPVAAGQNVDARAYMSAAGLVKNVGVGASLGIRYVS